MKQLKMREGEKRSFQFDFSTETEIVAGDTLASVISVTCYPGSNGGLILTCDSGTINSTAITLMNGRAAAANTVVTSVIEAPTGSLDNNYLLECWVFTTAGSKLKRLGTIPVNRV